MGRVGGSREYVLAYHVAVVHEAMSLPLALDLASVYVAAGEDPFPVGRAKGMKKATAERLCRDGWVDLTSVAQSEVAFRAAPTHDTSSQAPYELVVTPTTDTRSMTWGRFSEKALTLPRAIESARGPYPTV